VRAIVPRKRCATYAKQWDWPTRDCGRCRRRADRSGAGCGRAGRQDLWRAAARVAAGSVHPARGAGSLPGELRGATRPSALPDTQAEHQCPRYSDGGAYAPVPRLRRDDAPHAARAGRRIPADGGGADRDQVAPAAARAAARAGGGGRGPARRARPAAPRVRTDEGCRWPSAILPWYASGSTALRARNCPRCVPTT
jgi:hypothetical protein